MLGVLGFALLLPGTASPMHGSAADTVTVSMSAPAHVLHGNWYDYTITFTYTGPINGDHTPDYSVTDALPAELRFISAGINPQGLCPTFPPSGQSGTVGCTFNFSQNARTITLTITVEAATTGSITNTAQLASVGTASASTLIDPAPAGSITATLAGPQTIQLSSTAAPPRFDYTLVLGYTGPPIRGSVFASFVEQLPDQMYGPGGGGEGLREGCKSDDPQQRYGGTFRCGFYFTEDHRTRTIQLGVRPSGRSGTATTVVELSTGDKATWTTTVLAPPPEPEPPAPPPGPVAGPPAAPTATVAESFTTAGTAEPEAVTISPTAETVQVALTWPDSGSSFDATGFTLSSGTRTLAVFPDRSDKLRVTKKRGVKWLDVRIKGVHAGKLKFRIAARKLHGRTRVVAKIRQSKR